MDQQIDAPSPEIVLMAEVRAYFQVAYKRIIDNVPRAIDYDGLIALSTRVNAALVRGLGVDAEDSSSRLKEYFAEAPDVADLRAELQAKQKRLEEITTRLSRFSGKADAGQVSVARSSFRLNPSSPLSPLRAVNHPNSRPSSQMTVCVHSGNETEEKDNSSPQSESTAVSPEPQASAQKDVASPTPPVIDPKEIYASERRKAVESTLESLLDEVTPENFDTMSDRIVAWANSPEEVDGAPVLSIVVSAVVQKSLSVGWAPMGADICRKLIDKVGSHVTGKTGDDEPIKCGGKLASFYVLRYLVRGINRALKIQGTIQERKAYNLKIANFMKALLKAGVALQIHGVLSYLEKNFKNNNLPERLLELDYAILKTCGPVWTYNSLQDVFTAIEQRMEDVSPHAKLMLLVSERDLDHLLLGAHRSSRKGMGGQARRRSREWRLMRVAPSKRIIAMITGTA